MIKFNLVQNKLRTFYRNTVITPTYLETWIKYIIRWGTKKIPVGILLYYVHKQLKKTKPSGKKKFSSQELAHKKNGLTTLTWKLLIPKANFIYLPVQNDISLRLVFSLFGSWYANRLFYHIRD